MATPTGNEAGTVTAASPEQFTDTEKDGGAKPPVQRGSGEAGPSRPVRRWETWLFVGPALLFQLVWGWYPLATAFGLSFTDARLRRDLEFTGLESFSRVITDPEVMETFKITLIYAALTIILTFIIPILVAILLMEVRRSLMRWMMLLWFLPLSPIAGAVLWRYMYNADYGLMQWIATSLGFPEQEFLNSSSQVLFWLVIPGVIFFGPGLIYMATLQSIPASYYEAAEVEGAGFWRKIWTISLPRMRPVIVLMLTFAVIGSMQEFQWPALMTNGEPGGASRTIVMYIYETIGERRIADATTMSIGLFLFTMLLVIVMRIALKEDPDAPRRTPLGALRGALTSAAKGGR